MSSSVGRLSAELNLTYLLPLTAVFPSSTVWKFDTFHLCPCIWETKEGELQKADLAQEI